MYVPNIETFILHKAIFLIIHFFTEFVRFKISYNSFSILYWLNNSVLEWTIKNKFFSVE